MAAGLALPRRSQLASPVPGDALFALFRFCWHWADREPVVCEEP